MFNNQSGEGDNLTEMIFEPHDKEQEDSGTEESAKALRQEQAFEF